MPLSADLAHFPSVPFNRCTVNALALAAQQFQASPQPVEIRHVRAEHAALFTHLAQLDDPAERRAVFHDYALTRFWLHEERSCWPKEADRLRHSYAAVLRGWGIDANGVMGAVLKGWAEHRFGLRTLFHCEALRGAAHAQERYAASSMHGFLQGIDLQLDLLFTYTQQELARRFPGQRWLVLYRGTHDPEAYHIKTDGPEQLVEFNAVSSFTADREVAWEFGSRVWKVLVPLAKVVCASQLLDKGLLQGESEYIVLGGDYAVQVLPW